MSCLFTDGVKLDSSEGDNGLLAALCENYHVCIDEVQSYFTLCGLYNVVYVAGPAGHKLACSVPSALITCCCRVHYHHYHCD